MRAWVSVAAQISCSSSSSSSLCSAQQTGLRSALCGLLRWSLNMISFQGKRFVFSARLAQRAALFLSPYPTLTPHSRFWVTWPTGAQTSAAFLFFWPTARNIVYPSLLHLSAQSKYGTHQFWGFIPHKWLPVIPYSAHFLQGKKDSLLTLRLYPVYSLTRVRPGCWDRWWSSLTTPEESLLPLLLNNVKLN